MVLPLMPKATAVWLLDNTSLTFKQIAVFCGLHILEVEAMANDETGTLVKGLDPILNGQLTLEEIERCQADPSLTLELHRSLNTKSTTSRARYTPIASRPEKPDAILWLIKTYPDLTDQQIIRLVGTTKATIQSLRDKTHWNMQHLKPRSPVVLNMCSQQDLDRVLAQPKREPSSGKKTGKKPAAKKAVKS